jgi:hypothetical protein
MRLLSARVIRLILAPVSLLHSAPGHQLFGPCNFNSRSHRRTFPAPVTSGTPESNTTCIARESLATLNSDIQNVQPVGFAITLRDTNQKIDGGAWARSASIGAAQANDTAEGGQQKTSKIRSFQDLSGSCA